MMWVWIILAIAYVLSRIDLIPDVLGVWGWIDDIVVLSLLYRYLRRIAGPGRRNRNPGGRSTRQPRDEPPSSKDPYAVLGVRRDASEEEIRKAYLRCVNQYHPDKVAHLGEAFAQLAEQRFKEIQEAYQTLGGGKNRKP